MAPELLIRLLRSTIEEGAASSSNLTDLERVQRDEIIRVLREVGGNKAEAAKKLGIGRQTLYSKLKAYGIESSSE
jgi:transcriptional regulator of acetoin/glycerol metabolism